MAKDARRARRDSGGGDDAPDEIDLVRRLALIAEQKDPATDGHITRFARYAEVLARGLGVAADRARLIRHASQLHDVGNAALPDAILLRPGALKDDELDLVHRHTLIGEELLGDSPSPYLQLGAVIAASHHERWDGSGYPHQLAGDEIPLEGRICAVADVFEALTTTRPYRSALSTPWVYRMLETDLRPKLDPDVLQVAFEHRTDFEAIREAVANGG